MRKIIVLNYVSLDGFIAGNDGETDWFVWDKEVENYYKDFQDSIGTMLFGRSTYETMANYWATSTAASEDPEITNFMNRTKKFVFSKTLEKADWNNSELLGEIVPAEIVKMKEQSGKDIVIYGSGSIVSQFTKASLIDEYRIMLNPITLGSGKPLLQNVEDKFKLKLLDTKTFNCGNVLLRYQPED